MHKDKINEHFSNLSLDSRYHRQIILPQIGYAGQEEISKGRILMIGAGGLGCPILQYLASAGVGYIGIIDGDRIELSNLHRQILYNESEIGNSKAKIAGEKIKSQNSTLQISVHEEYVNNTNIISILSKYDIIIDGSDNFPTRYLVNDACVQLNKILVYGSIHQFEGQVAVFNAPIHGKDGILSRSGNYRDLFPTPPDPGTVASCSEAGVIGVLPGIIGSMMASETIKILTQTGIPLINKLWTFDALSCKSGILSYSKDSENLLNNKEYNIQQIDYEYFCGLDFPKYPDAYNEFKISAVDFLATNSEKFLLIDVGHQKSRISFSEESELPLEIIKTINEAIYLPYEDRKEYHIDMNIISKGKKLLLFCHHGILSDKAASFLRKKINNSNIYSLQGGISHLIQTSNTLETHVQ